MKQGDTTTVFSTGKVDFVLYPKVYSDFWFEVNRNHQDLMRAMQLAQVKLSDGSVIQFLNTFLGTDVKGTDPMEVGYASFLDALNRRVRNTISENKIKEVASQFSNHSIFPNRSDPEKPMFPDEADQ